jgi:hypothetical protein
LDIPVVGIPAEGIALADLAGPVVGIPAEGIALADLAGPVVGIPAEGIALESDSDNRLAFSLKIFRIRKF